MDDAASTEWENSREYIVPAFELPTAEGGRLGPGPFRQRRSLLLLFVHGPTCPRCAPVTRKLVRASPAFAPLDASVLVVAGEDPGQVGTYRFEPAPAVPILIDRDEAVTDRCLGPDLPHRPVLWVADRFGSLWATLFPLQIGFDRTVRDSKDWLQFMAVQCPECDVWDGPPPR